MKKNTSLFLVFLALSLLAAYLIFKPKNNTLSEEPLTEFAIADTAKINKIVITDHLGKTAVLERVPNNKLWKVNDKFLAREDAVDLILYTINRIKVRGNIGDNARENMLKLLATSGKKVEIYMGENEPAKIYYVGVPTSDHVGTIMLLEIPGIGRSEEPYITHIEGFTGFLSTRFFTDESEWRYTGVFEYPNLEFSSVKMINHIIPQESFEIKYDGGEGFKLFDNYDPASNSFRNEETTFDTVAVKKYLIGYRKVHVETFNTLLKPNQIDSLKNTSPSYTLTVTNRNGAENKVDLYLKPATKATYDDYGQLNVWDISYYWAKTAENEIGMAQTFNFMPLVNPVESLLGRISN